MPFTVTVARSASIKQGLSSPVRAAAGLRPLELPDGQSRALELRIRIGFDDADLTDRGWFLDTDMVAQHLDREATRLESGVGGPATHGRVGVRVLVARRPGG